MSSLKPSSTPDSESQRELLEQLLRLRTLVDAAFEGIGISRQGIIVDANEQRHKIVDRQRRR